MDHNILDQPRTRLSETKEPLEEWEMMDESSEDECEISATTKQPGFARDEHGKTLLCAIEQNDKAPGSEEDSSLNEELTKTNVEPRQGNEQLDAEYVEELHACASCNSYHYTSCCIYLMSWTQWLDYHLNYMPSEPFGHAAEGFGQDVTTAPDMQALYYRAEELDEMADTWRPNYLSNTRLKSDLMTKSSIDMYWNDEEWQKRLAKRARGQSFDSVKGSSNNPAEDCTPYGSDECEESVLDTLRADLGRHLPGTSTATLFKPKPDQSAEIGPI